MLKSLDEIKAVQLVARPVINGVDDPSAMSIDSTTPIETVADEINAADDKEEKERSATPKTEKKEEEKEETEPSSETPLKKDETKIEKRIGELTKKWRTAERERDFLKTKKKELEEELTKLKSKVPDSTRPNREDFDDDEAFLEALTDWKVDVKLNAVKGKERETQEESEEKTGVDEVYETMDQMVLTGREKYEDFDAVAMAKDLVVTPAMTEIILESEISADIMYYLGQNPDEAADIAKLTPMKIAKKLAEIEKELEKGEESEEEEEEETLPLPKPPVKKKKLTKTPEPITPVRESGAIDKDPSQMSPKEYRAWRERNKG